MLMLGIGGLRLDDDDRRRLRDPHVSGVVLFSRNYQSRDQLQALIESLRAWRPDDGFIIAVDQEGGRVQRLRGDGFTTLPPLAALGRRHDDDRADALVRAEEHAWVMASEMRAMDIDLSFAPVIDLERGNRAIGDRAFHADPAVVADLAQAYVRGMHMAGMAATLKHFPGHGSVREDTHVAVATDPRDRGTMRLCDMVPFVECIELGVEAVMMAHVIYPAEDTHPAGQSPVWIGRVLRQELEFAGLVFSDDVSMAAAGAGNDMRARVLAHLDAGCDLVLACQPDAFDAALDAVRGREPCAPERVAHLRGEVAGSWDALQDNPQRDHFLARLQELEDIHE